LYAQSQFLPRDAMLSAVHATPIPSVCPSVITRVDCNKTAERIEILSLSEAHYSFSSPRVLRKSDGFTPNGDAEYKGVATVDQYAAISRKR